MKKRKRVVPLARMAKASENSADDATRRLTDPAAAAAHMLGRAGVPTINRYIVKNHGPRPLIRRRRGPVSAARALDFGS